MHSLKLSISKYNKNYSKAEIDKKLKLNNCECCGFEVSDEDKKIHNSENVLLLTCPVCFYTENLDLIDEMDKGCIILAPEIKQEELNSLVKLIWFYESIEDTRYFEQIDSVISIYEQLKERENYTKTYWSESANDVDQIINFLHDISEKDKSSYDQRGKVMSDLLWLPSRGLFEKYIPLWNDRLKKYHIKNFGKIIKRVQEKVNK
tara:strand:+ start:2020 stop:2634 length:615 start_codon:yes stop_codon:yes gene_type:complete